MVTEALILALGVPTALVAAGLLWRRSWSQALADIRGIALQSVIVIVVMLVIAGGVATVLLSRGGDVIASLEAQDINTINNGNCATYIIAGTTTGVLATAAGSGTDGSCTFSGAAVTTPLCIGLGGTLAGTSGASSAVCTVVIPAL
ncbi:hypothetical protein [Candidatus Poriferisodalis sp.]|uniref:hypothetical protein n=1 Tax=Candidatus Poriferisodalis sp. TaxID=3101277 RepID=UPI003B01B207